MAKKIGNRVSHAQDNKKPSLLKYGMTREQMVDRMVEDDIQSILSSAMNDNDVTFLDSVLRGNGKHGFMGWKPYNALTNKQVVEEYDNREYPDR